MITATPRPSRPRRFFSHLILTALLLAAPLSAQAEPGEAPSDPKLAADGWRILKYEDVPVADFAALDENAISVKTDAGFGLLMRRTAGGEDTAGQLTWEWKVDKGVPPTDLSTNKRDDRSLAVHIWFAEVPGTTYFFASIKRSLAESFLGIPAEGKIITYVWGGTAPRGTVIDNPYFKSESKMIVLRKAGGENGEWMRETVDLVKDYQRAFGHAPRGVKFVALSADSDDTKARSAGVVRKMQFLK